MTLDGYTGNPAQVTAHASGSTITGTASNDVFTMGASADTVVMLGTQTTAATSASQGKDTIHGFSAGATTSDVIDISAFASPKHLLLQTLTVIQAQLVMVLSSQTTLIGLSTLVISTELTLA